MESIHYGTKSLGYPWPKIWKLVADHLKNSKSLEAFKSGERLSSRGILIEIRTVLNHPF